MNFLFSLFDFDKPVSGWYRNPQNNSSEFCTSYEKISHKVLTTTNKYNRLIITNSGYTPHLVYVIFEDEQDIKRHHLVAVDTANKLTHLDNYGQIYSINIYGFQEIEFATGKWKNVRFQTEYGTAYEYGRSSSIFGAISCAIEATSKLDDHETNDILVKKLLNEGHLLIPLHNGKHYSHNLHTAVRSNCIAVVKLLLERGYNVNTPRVYDVSNGFGPFATRSWVTNERAIHIAVQVGNPKMVKLLIDAGCDKAAWVSAPYTGWKPATPHMLAKSDDIAAMLL